MSCEKCDALEEENRKFREYFKKYYKVDPFEAVDLYEGGTSVIEIAYKYGVSRQAVYEVLWKYGKK